MEEEINNVVVPLIENIFIVKLDAATNHFISLDLCYRLTVD